MVSDNVDDELAERGFTGNPTLLLWETHADVGGPIVKDKAWFYGSYNHFKNDKVRSGIDPELATSQGIFDNYIAKLTFQAGERDKIIGYSQWGRKQAPNRNLSVQRPEESAINQDGWMWLHKAEWQQFADLWTEAVKTQNPSGDWREGVCHRHQRTPRRPFEPSSTRFSEVGPLLHPSE